MGQIAQARGINAMFAIQQLEAAQEMTDSTARIRELQYAVANVEACIRSEVEEMRKQGSTWAEIGGIFGVTRQAAQKRFRYTA